MHAAAFLMMVAGLAAGPKPGEEGTPEFEKAAALVKQLGHPRFAVREAAGKELIELGAAAVPALQAGIKSPDEEIRTRCTALLPKAQAVEWNRRADAYLAKPDEHRGLPLLAEWEKLAGKPDAGTRKVYAEMIRTNGDLLETAARDPKAGTDALRSRCRTVLTDARFGRDQAPAAVGDLAALFFLHRAVTDLPVWKREVAEWDADHPCHLLVNPALADAWAAKDVGPAMRRLVAAWAAARPEEDQVSNQCFCLTVYNHPFPEAVPVLAKIAKNPKAQPINERGPAVSALGKIGDEAARAALADLAADSTPLFRMATHRLGDHALAVLVLAGKKSLADYGLTEEFDCRFRAARQGPAVDLRFYSFPDDDARKKGVEKWKAEQAKK